MSHEEVDNAALGSALEALEAVALGVDHERTQVTVVVEGTQPQVAHTLLLQVNEVANDLLNPGSVKDALDNDFVDFRHEDEMKCNICMLNACASPACVDSLPNARQPHGGQVHRIPQAVFRWYKVLYTFRYKKVWYKVLEG